MKTRALVVCSLILACLLQGACGPASRDVLYGTWVNKDVWPAKTVMKPDGAIELYEKPSDTKILMAGKAEIKKKWTESNGDVYFQVFAKYTEGVSNVLPGTTTVIHQMLWKISKSGTVAEYYWVQVPAFDPELFPTKIDPAVANFNYIIAYREK
jgi:hypothetical protein